MKKLFLCCLLFVGAHAEVAPVSITAPEPKAWTGQRLPFFIELHARGSFVGTPTFSIPQIQNTFILKVGTPVISSTQIEGEEWFVQRHEFALFSQHNGALEIPAIPLRFSARDGFTGPATDFNAKSEALGLTIERPPGSEGIGFLVTTDSLEITEKWDPEPTSAEVGSVFKRTISQRAAQMTGMALAPVPVQAPEGTRIYPGQAEVTDKTERGDFLGERTETITYLIEKPGTITLPEVTFNWWNPDLLKLESKTLPAVSLEVPAPPVAPVKEPSRVKGRLILFLSALALLTAILWKRQLLALVFRKIRSKIDPPERVAARRFMAACRRNDASGAVAAWSGLSEVRDKSFNLDRQLQAEILALNRHVFGSAKTSEWNGGALAEAFRSYLKSKPHPASKHSALLPLNSK